MAILLLAGCSVEAPGLCHYRPGDGDVHLEALDGGVPPQDGSIYLPYSGLGSCVHTLRFDEGTVVTLTCVAGNPVRDCALAGVCVDPDTDSSYSCRGDVEL
jgi:hypothetical protein